MQSLGLILFLTEFVKLCNKKFKIRGLYNFLLFNERILKEFISNHETEP